MKTPLLVSVTLGLALVLVGGCGAPIVSLQEGPREYVATDYDLVIKRWTRSQDLFLFGELERALSVTATFETWDFRWAYTIRYARDYRLTIPQRQDLLAKSLAKTRDTHEFFVALYGSKQKFNNLNKPDSAWIVRLIDSTGNENAPSEIEAISKPSILQRRYYPYNTVWRKAFRVRFPRKSAEGRSTIAPDANWLGLRFAGPWGNTELVWKIAADQATPSADATTAPTPG